MRIGISDIWGFAVWDEDCRATYEYVYEKYVKKLIFTLNDR